jgi:D-serine deaminase-like pyridoxal phosphate-dependent protein
VAETVELFRAAGLAHDIVTGGGTGSYDIDTEATVAIPGTGPGLTDVQVGSYVFMDREYRAIGARAAGGGDAAVFEPFETALYVLLTAISQPVSDRITVDGGFKAFATDSVEPELLDVAGVRYRFAGDEHGILDLREAERAIGLDERLRLRVPHCDPTVNLYDGMWAAHDDEIVAWWPIAARGRGF